jgi:hypothetical protein
MLLEKDFILRDNENICLRHVFVVSLIFLLR